MAWSGEHRAFVIERFIECGGSIIATQRAFRIHFGLGRHDPVPHHATIKVWVSNFRQTSSALKKKSPGRPRTATGPENVANVRAAIERSPRRSARKHSLALAISNRSIRRILHRDLKMHPYKMVVAQELSERDFETRTNLCRDLRELPNDDVVIFTDCTSEPAQPQSFFIMPPKRKPSKVEAESVEEKPKRVRAARNADKPTEAEAPDSSEVAENGASGDAPRARRGRAAKVEAPVEEKEPVKEKKIKKPAAKPKAAVKPEKAPAKAKATRGRPKADKAKEDDEEPDNEDKPQEEEPKAPAKKTKKAAPAESEDKPKKAKTEATPLLNNTDTNYDTVNFNCKRKNSKGELPNFKISTWNVGGLKAWMKKDGLEYITAEDPDIFCLQETKCSEDKLPDEVKIDGYKTYWLGSDKQGYAGVALYTKTEPLEVKYGLGVEEFDEEGRCITAEYEKFYLVNVYVPNAGRGLTTLPKRLSWNEAFKTFVKELDSKKPVIVCGDMNVAHNEIDIANPKTNKKNAGFTQEERDGLTDFLGDGYVDSYRALYPDTADVYTFWSYMSKARSKNIGWRLDYFIVSEGFMENVCDNVVRSEVFGSDHCPVVLFVNL